MEGGVGVANLFPPPNLRVFPHNVRYQLYWPLVTNNEK